MACLRCGIVSGSQGALRSSHRRGSVPNHAVCRVRLPQELHVGVGAGQSDECASETSPLTGSALPEMSIDTPEVRFVSAEFSQLSTDGSQRVVPFADEPVVLVLVAPQDGAQRILYVGDEELFLLH